MSQRIYINDSWSFTECFNEAFACGQGAADLKDVRLPHTCAEVPFNYFSEEIYQMISGYRRMLEIPESMDGKRVFLVIEGAAHRSRVWLNGKEIAEHCCGYTAYKTELTKFLAPGGNLLAIEVDSRETLDQPPFGKVIDYMTYGGLYREVYLEITEQTYLDDVFVRPNVPEGVSTQEGIPGEIRFTGILESDIKVEPENPALYVRQKIVPLAGAARGGGSLSSHPLNARLDVQADTGMVALAGCDRRNGAFTVSVQVPDACLWDIESPGLYIAKTELYEKVDETGADLNAGNIICGWEAKDGKKGGTGKLFRLIDQKDSVFGFRRSEFKADGYYLNGRKVKLLGLNRHQSFAFSGYAMPESMQRLDADILKFELGVNAVRTSHYPCSQHFYDRCDEIGLLVFTEIPGWQNIGGAQWKEQALKNTEDMVLQYRNHPSIILWGVRINESQDDDALYENTNAAARQLDPTRPTGGVRYLKKSHLLEDVYTYNDFSYEGGCLEGGINAVKGKNNFKGCEPKKNITPDMKKAYLVSEYNGHMFPTKSYDCENHRAEHALRHAAVLDSVAAEEDIAGSFGWCMFDYNTHKEFGSGDHICYHGVTDMFRNAKPAAAVYAVQQEALPVLEVTSSMDIGEHPGGLPGRVYIITNADEVRMYRNNVFIRSYTHENSAFANMKNGPIEITDFLGERLKGEEGTDPKYIEDIKYILNCYARFGGSNLPKSAAAKAAKLLAKRKITMDRAYQLYGKYIGGWGEADSVYKFEAIKEGQVVKTVIKEPVMDINLEASVDHTELVEGSTYDMAAVRIKICDQNGNVLPYYQGSVALTCEGPLNIIGPHNAQLRGGMGGTYVKTTGEPGAAALIISHERCGSIRIEFDVRT